MTSKSSVSKKKKKITSCQANWVTFMMELVTEHGRDGKAFSEENAVWGPW